ncbi:hypothetical protein LINPERHAP1_LOCUS3353 [Linum perenne]
MRSILLHLIMIMTLLHLFTVRYVRQCTSRNEKCYWMYDKDPKFCGILSLDMSTEVFESVNLQYPPGLHKHDHEDDDATGLKSFDFCFMLKKTTDEIWCLLKYGVAESWTKLFIDDVDEPPEGTYFRYLDIWKDGAYICSQENRYRRHTVVNPPAKRNRVFCRDLSTGEIIDDDLEIEGTVEPFVAHSFNPSRVSLSRN